MPTTPVTLTVTSRSTPTITWRCARCDRPETFASSGRFRANSNGKLVDLWLVYRCTRCEATKNITVVERTPVSKLDPDLLAAASANDAATARRCSRDVDLLRRAGATVAAGDDWQLDDRDGLAAAAANGPVRLVFPEPLLVRLDAVAAAALGVPRRVARPQLNLPRSSPRPDALRLWCGPVDLRPGPA